MLQEQGCAIVGPYSKSTDVITAAQSDTIDIAILDVNLRGGDGFAAAHALQERAIPFFFATGRDDLRLLPPTLRSVPIFEKPYGMEDLIALVRALPAHIRGTYRCVADECGQFSPSI